MRNVNINCRIEHLKDSFLYAAAHAGRIEQCVSLLELGAETEWPLPANECDNDEDNTGIIPSESHQRNYENNDTPLLAAVRNGHKDVAALLLAHGADPMRHDRTGNTALHLAAIVGDEGMASLFAPNVSELFSLTNEEGMTAVDIAVQRGYSSFAEHLYVLNTANDEGNDNLEIRQINSLNHTANGSVEDTNLNDEENDDSSNESSTSLISFHGQLHDEIISNDPVVQYCIEFNGERPSLNTSNDDEHSFAEELRSVSDACNFHLRRDENGSHHELQSRLSGDSISTNDRDLSQQLDYMTQLAHSQSNELYQIKYVLNETLKEREKLKNELHEMKAIYCSDENSSNLSHKSLAELTSLEEQVKRSLDRIIKAKESLSKDLEDERMCVICRDHFKSVLLMTCRHLCVCSDCGWREDLTRCPLCREMIVERISVYS